MSQYKSFKREVLKWAKQNPNNWINNLIYEDSPNYSNKKKDIDFLGNHFYLSNDEYIKAISYVLFKYPIFNYLSVYFIGHTNGLGLDINDNMVCKHDKIMFLKKYGGVDYGIIEDIFSVKDSKDVFYLIKKQDNSQITLHKKSIIKIF